MDFLVTKALLACPVIEGSRGQMGSQATLELRVIKDLLGHQELREAMDSPVNRERLVTLDQLVQVEPMDRMELLELLELQAELEPLVLRDQRADQVRWVPRGRLVPQAPLETPAEQVTLDHRVNRVIRASKDRRVLKALKVLQDLRVIRESPVQPEPKDSKAIKERRDFRVTAGQLGTLDNLDYQETQDNRDPLDRLGRLDRQVNRGHRDP